MPKHLASWNPDRDVWETLNQDLFCGLSDVFSEIWPRSGMTRSGEAFELPMLVPVISGTGCSWLHTPRATRGGSSNENVQLLVTPTVQTSRGGRLNPLFVEWMMGLPAGYVTSPEIGLSRAQQLRALGNGVVPQQAAAAIAAMAVRERELGLGVSA